MRGKEASQKTILGSDQKPFAVPGLSYSIAMKFYYPACDTKKSFGHRTQTENTKRPSVNSAQLHCVASLCINLLNVTQGKRKRPVPHTNYNKFLCLWAAGCFPWSHGNTALLNIKHLAAGIWWFFSHQQMHAGSKAQGVYRDGFVPLNRYIRAKEAPGGLFRSDVMSD